MIPVQKERKPTPSEKRKELRKEKSRAAARCRRSRESEVFDDMLAVLPLPAGCREQLDKASVVRLAINYVKLREFMRDTCPGDYLTGTMMTKTFDVNSFCHFLLLLNDGGEIVYVTENIAKILGLSQFDLFGNSVYDFVHPCDHDDVRTVLHDKDSSACTFFSRMKCTLLPKGRAVHLKSASYKVVKFTGQAYRQKTDSKDALASEHHLLLTGELIPNPAEGDVAMDESMFMTHHSLDMKITYYDGKLVDVLGYDENALLGTSLYDYVHASDAKPMDKLFKTLYSKGQVSTERYRLLAGGGGYIWVVTQATVVVSKKTNSPKHVVCIHTVLSDIEQGSVIYAEVQKTGHTAKSVRAESPKEEILDAGSTDYNETSIMDATEALFTELNCDSGSSELLSTAETKSDIFAATVSLFKDFDDDDDDWLVGNSTISGTAELFDDDDHKCLRPMTPVDLSEGLLIDTTSLDACLDEELDMCMRAPYIPMCPSSDEVFTSAMPDGSGACTVLPPTSGVAPQRARMPTGPARPQVLPPLQRAADLFNQQQSSCSGQPVGYDLTHAASSPQPGFSAPCSPADPSPAADGTAGADVLQVLWSQLSHLFSSYGEAASNAALMAAIKSMSSRGSLAEQDVAIGSKGEGERCPRKLPMAAAAKVIRPGDPPDMSRARSTCLDYPWLDEVMVNLDNVLGPCMQEKAHLPMKRPLPQYLDSSVSQPQRKSIRSADDVTIKPRNGSKDKTATDFSNIRSTNPGTDCQAESEDCKRSLLLRLLLHGHEGRDTTENDNGWAVAQNAQPVDGPQWS